MAEFLLLSQRNYDDYAPEEFLPHLDHEAECVSQLYAERRFRSVWTRADGQGVVVLVEAEDEEDAWNQWRRLPLAGKGMLKASVIPIVGYRAFCPPPS